MCHASMGFNSLIEPLVNQALPSFKFPFAQRAFKSPIQLLCFPQIPFKLLTYKNTSQLDYPPNIWHNFTKDNTLSSINAYEVILHTMLCWFSVSSVYLGTSKRHNFFYFKSFIIDVHQSLNEKFIHYTFKYTSETCFTNSHRYMTKDKMGMSKGYKGILLSFMSLILTNNHWPN